MNDHHQWNASAIVKHNWPELYQNSDGNWERVWSLKLEAPAQADVDIHSLEAQLSDHEKWVVISIDGCDVRLQITTVRWGWEDDLYFYYYKVLEHLNDSLGEIEEIQGQKRDLWPPWQWETKKLYPLDHYMKVKE